MITDFTEAIFPENLSRQAVGGPTFFTSIVSLNNGKEYRRSNSPFAKRKYNLSTNVKNGQDAKDLFDFFYFCRGRALGFRFKDWGDYSLSNEYLTTGDGVSVLFEITKRYGKNITDPKMGDSFYIRRIFKPRTKTIVLKSDAGTLIPDSLYSVSDFGEIIFDEPPEKGETILISCTFDTPARFESDFLPLKFDGEKCSWHNIGITEIII